MPASARARDRSPRLRRRIPGRRRRRSRLIVALAALILLAAVLVVVLRPSAPPPIPLPGIGQPAPPGDPFKYVSGREADFVARATAGSAHVLFTKSPGGAVATAARVASLRGAIDRATAGTGVDPNLLEALVFVESAGNPTAMVGGDPTNAAGLTQILPETGQTMLGMHIDVARSRALTAKIDSASLLGQTRTVAHLQRERAAADQRFNPADALAAAVRYLRTAQTRFGRADLAIVSYHMGIGNLQQVLDDYDGGKPVPYVQLYFDTAPDHQAKAFNLLSGLGDDSSLYYWRVLGAAQIMQLYRTDRRALNRLNGLQTAIDSAAQVLHPPDVARGFSDPAALDRAYAHHEILPLPSNAAELGLEYDPAMGSLAGQVGGKPALYRGLRTPALDLLIELAARVRTLSGGAGPLIVGSTVTDAKYQNQLGESDPTATTGYSFTIERHYVNRAQAEAFQAMLDRLQALNVIAWQRFPDTIEVTVASDASRVIVDGP